MYGAPKGTAAPRPERTAHTIRRPRARQPTEGFQGSPRVPPRPREDGPYSPAGLGVRHPTEGSQGSPSLQPLLTREDGPNNPAGLGRDNPPGLPGFSKGSTSSRPERTAHFLAPA
ncbi:hypothetical protein RRG08_065756 [Elysia crispata]|uniref:Uncharacterized protein n=1 Tax=Elysia crispata TaxID=231223 RepID=A0AAE0Z6J6_9GAST|nr:hypothetical protein RRG08_065756 [Elysia crispata]